MSLNEPFGLKDVPVSDYREETLGMKEYAEALTEFVKNCDTPLTIALQGDWGSGKTSLMNGIRQNIGNDPRIKTVWFNTWQYSQFGQAETLALSLLASFVDSSGIDEENKQPVKNALKFLGALGKAAVVAGATAVGQGEAGKEGIAVIEKQMGKKADEIDSAALIKELKDKLEVAFNNRIKEKREIDRVVVFVDDLDRLVPIRAVELLEALKLFLDLDGCVFILACDYQVIIQGLLQKFGVEGELKGKSFFDKIIQLPFNMPVSQYKVEEYFNALLMKIGVDSKPEDHATYVKLVDYSVGFNPRSMKRLFNSLLLLRIVAKKKFGNDELQSTDSEKMRMLFGVLCMQNAYEAIYKYLLKEDISDELFKSLINIDKEDLDDVEYKSLFNELGITKDDDSKLSRLKNFIQTFYKAIQLDSDDNNLSQSEIDNLQSILTFSAVVSTESADQSSNMDLRCINRRISKNVLASLNEKYSSRLNNIHLQAHEYRLYQERSKQSSSAYIYLTIHADERRYFHINWILGASTMSLSFTCPKTHVNHFSSWVKSRFNDLLPSMTFTKGTRFAGFEVKIEDTVSELSKEELFLKWTEATTEKILPILEKDFPLKNDLL